MSSLDLIACVTWRWFHRILVATDLVLVSFAIGRREAVALLLLRHLRQATFRRTHKRPCRENKVSKALYVHWNYNPSDPVYLDITALVEHSPFKVSTTDTDPGPGFFHGPLFCFGIPTTAGRKPA